MEAQIEKQLDKIMPEDLARTFESAYHVFIQGNHDHMDDLLKHGGTLLRKAAQRFTPTQMVVGLTAAAALTIVVIARTNNENSEGEAHDLSARKPQLGGNKDQSKGAQNKGQGEGQGNDNK